VQLRLDVVGDGVPTGRACHDGIVRKRIPRVTTGPGSDRSGAWRTLRLGNSKTA
jgi:hypothetical protein